MSTLMRLFLVAATLTALHATSARAEIAIGAAGPSASDRPPLQLVETV